MSFFKSLNQYLKAERHGHNNILKAGFVICLGIIGLLVFCKLDIKYASNSYRIYVDYVRPLGTNISNSLIILGTGTLLLDLNGYLSYFRIRLSEVFTSHEMIDLLNSDYKRQLKYQLLKSIYKPDTEDSQALLTLFDSKLANMMMDDFYYESYSLLGNCTIKEINGGYYIHKHIKKTVKYKEINSSKENSISTFLGIDCNAINEIDEKQFTLHSVRINDKLLKEDDYTIETNRYSVLNSKIEKISYDCMLKENMPFENSIKLDEEYTVIAPLTDREYNIRLRKLCKKMRCSFIYDSSKMDILAKGFNFSTSASSDFEIKSADSFCELESNDWLLPGEGISFTVIEKSLTH